MNSMRWISNSTLPLFMLLFISCSGGQKAQLPKQDEATKEQDALKKGDALKEAQVKKEAKQPDRTSAMREFRLTGQVSLHERILLSFKVSANIEKIYVQSGSKVKKGQLLAELYDGGYKLAQAAAKFRLEKAENKLAQSERDFRVEKDLREKDISSLAQYQNAELAHKDAQVEHKLAQVDMLVHRSNLGFTRLRAPKDGIISQQFKYVGDLSTGGPESGAIFEMFPLADSEIHLRAPEALLAELKVGAQLDVSFPAAGLSLPAKITRIVTIVRETDRTFLVVAKLTKHDERIVPGLFVEGLVKEAGE